MDKVAIFIDAGCLDKILQNSFGKPRLDFRKLIAALSEGKELLRAYYYHCMPYQGTNPTLEEKDRYRKKQSFIHRLSEIPRLECRQGRLARYSDPSVKGGLRYEQKRVDVMMAGDLVRLSATGKINDAILITGDSDFVPAIIETKQFGIVVHLFYVPPINDELREACDERTIISQELIDKIRM
ncbi:MAG: NYN domain-containing protein [Pseudomonadota bacterium]